MTEVSEARANALRGQPTVLPCGASRSQPFRTEMQFKRERRQADGRDLVKLEGYASVVEAPYEMWDMFGPYHEVISRGAFDKTLKAKPDVSFLVNHRGVTMARTTNGSLELSADSNGLHSRAWLNPERTDVHDLLLAIEERNVTEMSFAFTLPENAGRWSADFGEFRIDETNIDRGDVSAVNYGANPYTSVAARAREILADLEHLPAGAALAAMARLQHRTDLVEPAVRPVAKRKGRTLNQLEAWLLAETE